MACVRRACFYGGKDGKRFGDFEMNAIAGGNSQGAILTMVERGTNMLFMKKLKYGKDAEELAKAVVQTPTPYKGIIKTITTDNDPEFSAHAAIAKELDTAVHFADPYSSWQKGAIENANGFIRQYITKASPIKHLKEKDIRTIMDKINKRPRKKLDITTTMADWKRRFEQFPGAMDYKAQDIDGKVSQESAKRKAYGKYGKYADCLQYLIEMLI